MTFTEIFKDVGEIAFLDGGFDVWGYQLVEHKGPPAAHDCVRRTPLS
jgi:hypothetical protein